MRGMGAAPHGMLLCAAAPPPGAWKELTGNDTHFDWASGEGILCTHSREGGSRRAVRGPVGVRCA